MRRNNTQIEWVGLLPSLTVVGLGLLLILLAYSCACSHSHTATDTYLPATPTPESEWLALEKVDEFAQDLSARDKRILHGRLLAPEPLTLAELGREFSVSRERVRQLEARLLKDLRAYMEASLVDFEYYAPSDD